MSFIYAMSDIHGWLEPFEEALTSIDLSGDNRLVLLGDYVHGGSNPYKVLDVIMGLERGYGREKVICLKGNHEQMVIDGRWSISTPRFDFGDSIADFKQDRPYIEWMKTLRHYYSTDNLIFCHAGIEEDAGDLWEWGTPEHVFLEKYPAETGKFYKDIIAGHVGTSEIARDPNFQGIYFDGFSHYYIDGTVDRNWYIPVLKIDCDRGAYSQIIKGEEIEL